MAFRAFNWLESVLRGPINFGARVNVLDFAIRLCRVFSFHSVNGRSDSSLVTRIRAVGYSDWLNLMMYMKKILLSLPLLAICAVQQVRADAAVTFNEVMYHPASNETAMEWVELRNLLAVDIDMSDWSIRGTINYTFPSNTIIRGRSHLVVAISPATLMAGTGLTGVLGPFTSRLDNDGGTLELRNNSGRLVDEVSYDVDNDWPVAADGSGASLAKRDPDSASGPAKNWTASEQPGGTPGAVNFVVNTGFVAPAGLVSYWNFNETGATATDQAGQNHGALGAGATRAAGGIGGGISFNGTSAASVNVGPGANNSFAVANGLTIEAVLQPNWNGTGSATIFRKASAQPTNYNGAVLASAPVAYWRLNDSTTAISDSTANARNGTATAGVQLSQPGLVPTDPSNNAIRVGGAERVVVNGFEKIGAGGYSVEYWVKVNALPTSCCQNLVGDGEAAGDFFMMNYILGPAQGTAGGVRPHFGPGNTPVSLNSASALQVGSTYHIVTTWDATKASDNAVIYINGMADQTGTITRNVPVAGATGANPVYIGKDNRDTTDGNNTIDEAALYNRALSAADVAAHYFAGTAVNFEQNRGNAIQLAFQNDGNNALANPPVAAGPVLSFGLTVGGIYSELDMPLDGQAGRPTLAALQNGQPHHISASYNPVTGVKAIYIDGTLRFSTTLAGALAANNLAAAIIGNSEVNGSAAFNGLLDEVAYWGKSLSGTEVAAHAAAVQAGRDYFTPTVENSATTLAFSEVSSATNSAFFVEIMNYGAAPVALGNFLLRHDGAIDHAYNFPATTLSPGAYVAVTAQDLGFAVVSGDKFFLLQTSSGKAIDAVVVKNRSLARAPQITSPWAYPGVLTPGAANVLSFRSEIVINEIMHSHALLAGISNQPPQKSPEEWLELHNRSANPVDLTGWQLAGGISYLFTAGQTIPAGGYLVVSDDVPYLRALYPSLTIVGDYGGKLGGSDRVVLRDPSGNTADEVRYYTGGNWPVYSGGGGSSLELRDPASDNSKAEAWAASDESAKGGWQVYSYRMVANIPAASGQPTTWQDLIVGLQSAGECLIDDLSVIESPTNNPVQVIANGDFENGLAGWRVLGTHNQSRIETDPDNAGNHVLRVVATGPQEHMHNHIERTLNAGRTITPGREYQITYRARWLAGNNLLNTRLYFNRSAKTIALPRAVLNGTPGAQNSSYIVNAGPTFSNFGHKRVAPAAGEAVTVTVVAEDPQGVNSCNVFWSVNSGAWANAAMTHQGGGVYTGTIPGQVAAAVVQFYVRAIDGLGAAATYPARGTNSGALFKVSDGLANLPLAHNFRVIVTPANIDFMHGNSQGVNQTNVMSNDLLPCTIVYDEQRAYYDCGVHLRGSQRGRYSDVRTGYHINFPPDDLFRGVNPVMLIDRSGAGDTPSNRQEEIVLKHMLNRAGNLPGTYGEICHLLAPRNAFGGAAQFFPRHEDVFVESAFENGGDGQQFEMELIYYPTSANAAGYKNPQPDSVVGTDMTNLGDDKENYRYNFMLKGGREEDDYSRFIRLCKAWSLTGTALDVQTKALMDIDQWMRAYAFVSLGSVGDMYSFGNNHNFFTYSRPSDGRFVYFPWDMDFSFNRGETAALVGDQNVAKVVNLPGNLRLMYGHMLDIIDVCFNSAYMTYWVNHYTSFAPGQDYKPRAAYIQNRANYARTTINAQTGTNFTVAGTNFVTTNNIINIAGTASAAVRTIMINGVEYPIIWTSLSNWTARVVLSPGTNTLNVSTYDLKGRPLAGFNRTVTVSSTSPVPPPPESSIVINEIMFNPLTPGAEFVEIYNNSTVAYDLSGWRFNGLDYTFPPGSVITNRQYLVLTRDVVAYHTAYGSTIPVFGQFAGNLQSGGETITLIKPGATTAEDVVIDKVRYEGVLPWPVGTNGIATASSIQLIDVREDNSRSLNWSTRYIPAVYGAATNFAGATNGGWRRGVYSGVIQGPPSTPGTNFLIFLGAAGDVYLDDLVLVTGTVPEVGINWLANGDFEGAFSPAWSAAGTHSNTVISTTFSHSGNGSLHVIASGPGAGFTSTLRQFIPAALTNNTPFTLSYWFYSTDNSTPLTLRTTPGSAFTTVTNAQVQVIPPFSLPPPLITPAVMKPTPGSNNIDTASLLAIPPLWLNELQAQNTIGIADAAGDRDPWIELYNAGTNTLSLDTYYLADNYDTNLVQWPFPAGATIAPGQFKIIWADGEPGESTGSELHTSFRLAAGSGTVALVRVVEGQPQVLDYLTYTGVGPGLTYGDYPDGQPFDRQEFYRATPGRTNDNTAAPIVAYINEWMAANTGFLINTNNGNRFDDWFELYNPGNTAANLAGYFLTDNLGNKTQFQIPVGYAVPAHGFLLVWADGQPNLNTTNDSALHVSFKLAQDGEAIGLFASDGTVIDTVDFRTEAQFNNISEGRFPDGPNPNYFLTRPTPLAANSIWANRYPVLAEIPEASILGGETLAFTASASDPDLPAQTLTYSLTGSAPTNAVINATNGVFSWSPSAAQTPSTNLITVRVTDSGVPALAAARTFKVVVGVGFRVSNITRQPNGDVTFSVGATVGKTYRVEYKQDLGSANWLQLGVDQVATSTSLIITDNTGANLQRFYRVLQVD